MAQGKRSGAPLVGAFFLAFALSVFLTGNHLSISVSASIVLAVMVFSMPIAFFFSGMLLDRAVGVRVPSDILGPLGGVIGMFVLLRDTTVVDLLQVALEGRQGASLDLLVRNFLSIAAQMFGCALLAAIVIMLVLAVVELPMRCFLPRETAVRILPWDALRLLLLLFILMISYSVMSSLMTRSFSAPTLEHVVRS